MPHAAWVGQGSDSGIRPTGRSRQKAPDSRLQTGLVEPQNPVRSLESGAGFCSQSDFSSSQGNSRLKAPDSRLQTGLVEPQNPIRSPESGAGFCSQSDFSSSQGSNRLKLVEPQDPVRSPARPALDPSQAVSSLPSFVDPLGSEPRAATPHFRRFWRERPRSGQQERSI